MAMELEAALTSLRTAPKKWLVTGAAGFIGSHLVEFLLGAGQRVVGLDNFTTGHRHNLDDVRSKVSASDAQRFEFIEGDIRDLAACQRAAKGCDVVLHEAALGSVPRSIEDPITTNDVNISGFVNMLVAARDVGVGRFVYAASSSTYGDHPGSPKVEDQIGSPLSPYAVTKRVNELYAEVFESAYGTRVAGLRYFNVFGPRQDPNGAYAAVIPRWVDALVRGEDCVVFGDGETSRDFCYVRNVVQANVLAGITDLPTGEGHVFNIACGARTTLNELFGMIRDRVAVERPELAQAKPRYEDFRAGDVRHSLASVEKAERLLGYRVTDAVADGLDTTVAWFLRR